MIRWIESISGWDQNLPAVLFADGVTAERRLALLRALVVRSTGLAPDAVAIAQTEGRPPMVEKPIGSGLHLSIGSRGPCTAAAIAASPVGVDIELVDEGGEVPWRVLHDREAAFLAQLHGEARAAAFARLWSLKEAYVKALGVGLFREPSSFAVNFLDEEGASIHDPGAPMQVAEAGTRWRPAGGVPAAISIIVLDVSGSR